MSKKKTLTFMAKAVVCDTGGCLLPHLDGFNQFKMYSPARPEQIRCSNGQRVAKLVVTVKEVIEEEVPRAKR